MADWTASMQQTFEYYIVDPGTWKEVRKLDKVKSCTISRDTDAETLGSVSIDIDENIGECYIRAYLITIQNGLKERHPLGTFMVQTPLTGFDGRVQTISADAYTPLIELKEKLPPIGFYVPKESNIMEQAYLLARENMRAPVVKTTNDATLYQDFISTTSDTWLAYLSDLAAEAKFVLDLDEMGRVLFAPKQDAASLQAVWTYDNGNSSILLPSISVDHDLYGIPNVIEVVYSSSNSAEVFYEKKVNDDPNSPISTINRGREIMKRITDPNVGNPTKGSIKDYATQALRDASSLEYTITYTHAYCPVRIGDCVRLNYPQAKLNGVKAKVISQSIKCEPGCPVTEKAVYTQKLWG